MSDNGKDKHTDTLILAMQVQQINEIRAAGMIKYVDYCEDCDFIGCGATSTYHTIYYPGHHVKALYPLLAPIIKRVADT